MRGGQLSALSRKVLSAHSEDSPVPMRIMSTMPCSTIAAHSLSTSLLSLLETRPFPSIAITATLKSGATPFIIRRLLHSAWKKVPLAVSSSTVMSAGSITNSPLHSVSHSLEKALPDAAFNIRVKSGSTLGLMNSPLHSLSNKMVPTPPSAVID